MPVATTFWETFFLFLIFLPLLMIWAFALVDIFRRDDMGGLAKALWVLVIFLLPFIGTLIYLIVRPAAATKDERIAIDQASREFVAKYSPDDRAAQLKTLSDLHDRGKLTDEEFAAEKARITGTAATPAATPPPSESPPATAT
jgi:Phospholipase_D-nuclease N-terminal/Short C-terminal domain